jgi:hypothetical protein
MNKLMKTFLASLALLLISTAILAQAPTAYSKESDASDKALSFITDVIQLDMTKYSTKLEGYSVDYPEKLGGVAQEGLTYILESEESKLDIFCRVTNGTLTYCLLTADKGVPLYVKQSDNFLDAANNLLDSYQSWTDDLSVQGMKDMLNMADATKDVITTSGNMKLEVVWYGDYPSFYWKSTFNGVDYTVMGFAFDEGKLAFGDDRSLFKIGSTVVTVSKEEAIETALKHIETYSYTVGMGSEPSIEVTDFDIAEEKITAELLTWQREPLTLYPYWNVKLKLASTHPGFVTAINVGVWADTEEVLFCYPMGWGGSIPVENPTTELSVQPEMGEAQPLNTYLIAIAVAAIIAIIVVAVAAKKKQK